MTTPNAIAVDVALNGLIDAWEALEGGANHSPLDVEDWLSEQMAPAVNRARKVLGRKAPNEQ